MHQSNEAMETGEPSKGNHPGLLNTKRAASDELEKDAKHYKAEMVDDKKLEAIVEDYFVHTFQSEQRISPGTKEMVIRFGVEVAKHVNSQRSIDSLMMLNNQMKLGFENISAQLKSGLKELEDKVHVESVSKTGETRSYAEAVAKIVERKPEEKSENVRENGCYTILQAEDNSTPSDEQRDKWTEVLGRKQKQYNLKVNNVHVTKKKNMAVTFKNRNDQKRFEESLNSDPIPGAGIRSSSDRRVVFAIRGVPGDYDADKLVEELYHRNADHPYLLAEKLDVKDARKPNGNMVDDRRYKTFKLWASSKYAGILLDHCDMYINLRRVHLELWRPNERCSSCLDKGHISSDCRQKLACKHCGGEHRSYQCKQSRNDNNHHCVICFRAGKPHNHRAVEASCPVLKNEIEALMKITAAKIVANHGC